MACPTGKITIVSSDPRINYNLLPDEKLMTCPYNLSHAVRPIRFAKHVLKCYWQHCKEQALNNEKSLFSICQYDRSHHVRNEELAQHEAQCKEEIDKDDGWKDDEVKESKDVPEQDIKVATLQDPPKIDQESMKAIVSGEDWGADAEYEPQVKFDRQKRIQEYRLAGYDLINNFDNVGLTKSEKKEFYRREENDMKACSQIRFLDRMKEQQAANGIKIIINNPRPSTLPPSLPSLPSSSSQPSSSSLPSSTPSCASMYGYETDSSLASIREDED